MPSILSMQPRGTIHAIHANHTLHATQTRDGAVGCASYCTLLYAQYRDATPPPPFLSFLLELRSAADR